MQRAWLILVLPVATGVLSRASLGEWTDPVVLSDQVNDVQWPRLCPDGSGGMHLVYRFRFRPWRFAYRHRDGAGNWSPIEYPCPMPFEDTPCVVEDPQGRPHIFFAGGPDGNWPEHWTQVYETWKQDGAWLVSRVTPPENLHHGYPRAVVDAQGRMHLVYIKTDLNRTTRSDVWYRLWNGAGWSDETFLGRIDNFYYQHPHIARDAVDNIHVAWVDLGGSRDQVVYRRQAAGMWLPAVGVGGSVGNSYITFPRIVAAGPGRVLIVANDDNAGTPVIKGVLSTDGGTTWGTYSVLAQGTYAAITAGRDGTLHLAYAWPGETATGYLAWNGTWSAPLRITVTTSSQWSPDIGVDRAGLLHIVYDDYRGMQPHVISYANSASLPPAQAAGKVAGAVRDQYGIGVPNVGISTSTGLSVSSGAGGAYALEVPAGSVAITATRWSYTGQTVADVAVQQGQTTALDLAVAGQPPLAVSGLEVAPVSTRNCLSWLSSASPQANLTRIVCRTDRFPAGPDDGSVILEEAAVPGAARSWVHAGLENGRIRYYAVYACFREAARYYSPPAGISATPAVQPDMDHDGDVDQVDFGLFQACYSGPFVEQPDPACRQARMDADTDVDSDDATVLMNCFTGPAGYAAADCAG
jgi:hypothetical protein